MASYLFTGGSGLIGRALVRQLLEAGTSGTKITLLTRDPDKTAKLFNSQVKCVRRLDEIGNEQHFDYVINLAGAPIADRRWSKQRKRLIWQSRVELTRELVDLFGRLAHPPEVLLSGSAVGWYGDGGDQSLDEDSAAHNEFTHQLCQAWEVEARKAESFGTRVCLLRTGLVLSDDGGFLSKMAPAYRLGLGAQLGDGHQWMSWIHIDDMLSAMRHLLDSNELSGVFNLTAPNAETNQNFGHQLARRFNRRQRLVTPGWILRLALGEMSRLLLTGQQVRPARLLQTGFKFRYAQLNQALDSLWSS